MSAVRLGDLDGERADTAGRPEDRHSLTIAHPSDVADRLQCRDAGVADGGGVDERDVRRFDHQSIGPRHCELRESAPASTEYLVAGAKQRYGGNLCADRL